MITLLASIVGFISSIIPEILKLFKDNSDKKHALDLLDRQIGNNRQNDNIISAKTLEELEISKDIAEQSSLYSTYNSKINWVDALNGSVRPVLAYSFFMMYVSVKFTQYKAIKSTAILVEYLDILWNIDDQAIFAGIISFYFGQSTFNKLWKRK